MINLKENIWIEGFDNSELMEEALSINECCVNCHYFNQQIGEMGVCEFNPENNCPCTRLRDMFDTRCENHKCPEIIYSGKTSEIPEELARELFELQQVFNTPEYLSQDIDRYRNYRVTEYVWFDCTLKESIQSALTKEGGSIYKYCIIFKK